MNDDSSALIDPLSFSDIPAVWQACLNQAWEAFAKGSLPIGAVIVDDAGKIIATGRNRLAEKHSHSPHLPNTPYLTGTPLAHAEVNAILQMGFDRPSPRPTLFTTVEPCPLCIGAARVAGIGKVTYAARDAWAGSADIAAGSHYIRRVGPTASGPVDGLEDLIITWLLVSIQHDPDSPFMNVWKEPFPRAFNAAWQLKWSGGLEEAQSLPAAWELLSLALEGAPSDVT